MIKKLGRVWLYAFTLVTTLFITCIIIYGFDIKKSKTNETYNKGRAVMSLIENSGKQFSYFKIDDHFAFMINHQPNLGDREIIILEYERNLIPLCFFCGTYSDKIGSSDKVKPDLGHVSKKEIIATYEELSFMGPDDEDCMISFSGVFLCYFILLTWGLIRLIQLYFKKQKALLN